MRNSLILSTLLLLCACSNERAEQQPVKPSEIRPETAPSNKADPKKGLCCAQALYTHFSQAYQRSLKDFGTLKQASLDFIQTPNTANLEQLQESWEQSHASYQTAALSSLLSIRHPQLDISELQPNIIHPIAVRLDQYPMLGGYLDEIPGYPNSGLIHSEFELNFDNLNQEHQFSDPAYVTLGFHALAFMLFGDSLDKDAQLERFRAGAESTNILSRRKQYVSVLLKQIERDLTFLNEAWAQEGYYWHQLHQKDAQWFRQFSALLVSGAETTLHPHLREQFASQQTTLVTLVSKTTNAAASPAKTQP